MSSISTISQSRSLRSTSKANSDFVSNKKFQRSFNRRSVISKEGLSIDSRTAWPVTNCEVPFLPEFPLHSRINESSFEIHSIISSGAYGKVFKVKHKSNGVVYAMKSIPKAKIFQDSAVNQIKDELHIQKMCGYHPFLIPCPFYWQNRKNIFMVTEFVDGGDLQKLWHETGRFDEDLVKIYVGELALVLDFLHNAGIIYRDLKMENILLDSNGHIKLIDFGLSKWLPIGSRTGTICGTLHYMAPEVLSHEYSHAIDWWSLGVVMYALLQGQFPFCEGPGSQEPSDSLRFDVSPASSETACRLVRNLLTRDPAKRLRNLRTLQNHAFYHRFDFEALRSKHVDPLSLLYKQRNKRRCLPEESADDFENFDRGAD